MENSDILIVDLFGPIIDISVLEPFKRISGSRFMKEDELAKRLNSGVGWPSFSKLKLTNWPIFGRRRFSQLDIHSEVLASLKEWQKHEGLVDTEILQSLVDAVNHGLKILVFSTVPDSSVFESAVHAIRRALRPFLDTRLENKIEFKNIPRPKTGHFDGWDKTIEEFNKSFSKEHDPSIIFVIHDNEKDSVLTKNSAASKIDKKQLVWNHSADVVTKFPFFVGEIIRQHKISQVSKWLQNRVEIKLADHQLYGEFLVFDRDKIDNIKSTLCDALGYSDAQKKPACIYLAGSPGSGKSFFVKQFANSIRNTGEADVNAYPNVSLSSVPDLRSTIKNHIGTIIESVPKSKVAFLDEVDTVISESTGFRYLMDAMTGDVMDDDGKKSKKLDNFIWFFAGSAGKTEHQVREKLRKYSLKVDDFFGRMYKTIELPGTDLPFDAMLMAISRIKSYQESIVSIDKKLLLAFAITDWAHSRQLEFVIESIMRHRTGTENDRKHLKFSELEGGNQSRNFETALEIAKPSDLGDTRMSIS
jgi:ATPase family associated with various cellular activities (AAA)